MNENFINTWATNAELGRHRSLRDPIAKRRKRESKTFDISHPLAQAILKGGHTGSPVDCMVISPDFELKGQLPLNEFLQDARSKGIRQEESYLTFLMQSLEGKQPGLE